MPVCRAGIMGLKSNGANLASTEARPGTNWVFSRSDAPTSLDGVPSLVGVQPAFSIT